MAGNSKSQDAQARDQESQARTQELEVGAREKYLLPEGCVELKDAIDKINDRIDSEDLLTFDGIIQQLLQQQFQALVHVCMGPANLVKNLAPALLHEAIRFLEPLLEGTNAAEMYLAQHPNRSQATAEIREEVQTIFNATAPRSPKPRRRRKPPSSRCPAARPATACATCSTPAPRGPSS